MRFIYHFKYYVIFFILVLFLKSITKLVKHCNKNDEIKHVLSNWKRPFRGKTEQRNCYEIKHVLSNWKRPFRGKTEQRNCYNWWYKGGGRLAPPGRLAPSYSNVYPYKPQFYYIKVGCKGLYITWTCLHDDFIVSDVVHTVYDVFEHTSPI